MKLFRQFLSHVASESSWTWTHDQGILKGEVSLYHWPPVWLVWNQLYDNWQFLFLFAKQTNPKQSNRRSTVQGYFPLQYSLPRHWDNEASFLPLCIGADWGQYIIYDGIFWINFNLDFNKFLNCKVSVELQLSKVGPFESWNLSKLQLNLSCCFCWKAGVKQSQTLKPKFKY